VSIFGVKLNDEASYVTNKTLFETFTGCTVPDQFDSQCEFNLDKYRVVLDQKERRTDLRIYNTSDEFISFRVQLLDMAMNENGEIKPIEDYLYSAKNLVRVSPRMAKNVTPHTYQKFRDRARGVKEIGEFRTHLLIEELLPPFEGEVTGMIIRPNLRVGAEIN
jgi:hypothetical protein